MIINGRRGEGTYIFNNNNNNNNNNTTQGESDLFDLGTQGVIARLHKRDGLLKLQENLLHLL